MAPGGRGKAQFGRARNETVGAAEQRPPTLSVEANSHGFLVSSALGLDRVSSMILLKRSLIRFLACLGLVSMTASAPFTSAAETPGEFRKGTMLWCAPRSLPAAAMPAAVGGEGGRR